MSDNAPQNASAPPSSSPSPSDLQGGGGRGGIDWRWPALVAGLLAAAAIGVALVLQFVESERVRHLRVWQDRLSLVADSRTAAIDAWVRHQNAEMGDLAANTSVQLFMTELDLAGGRATEVTDAPAQLDYLGNLLQVTADRVGFDGASEGPAVDANVLRRSPTGLAVVSATGQVVLATRAFAPPPLPDSEDSISGARLLDLSHLDDGRLAATFVAPIYGLQSDPAPGGELGYVVGRKAVGAELFALLRQPGLIEPGLEILLLRRREAAVQFISPLADGSGPLERALAADTPEFAAGQVIESPGGFGRYRDYRDREVFATGRRLAEAPWHLMVKVDGDQALAESETRLGRLMAVMLLAIALIGAGIAVIWRHAASRRSAEMARLYRETAEALTQQRDLLRLVTDYQPTSIVMLDDKGTYRFANKTAAEHAGVAADDLIGKSIGAVLGPAAAQRTLAHAEQAIETAQPVSDMMRITGKPDGGGRQVFIADHVPLPRTDELPQGVLVVERDLTVEFNERARRERMLDDLIGTLVGVVDCRDPFAADHSQKVGRLAHRLAVEIGLDKRDCEAARTAGMLMNIGKILVPQDVLTREGGLSEDEQQLVRHSMQASADLIAGIDFDGPVVETLRQAQERVDGGGSPDGLTGEEILPTARILSVANAFVGMVSDRSYRPGLSVEDSVATLMRQIGGAYDRGVVAALVSYLDNKGGREAWEPTALAGE